MKPTSSEPASLVEWLRYVEGVHTAGIDLGLERIGAVARRLGFEPPAYACAPRTVIVAGTNGKGSTCIALEAVLAAHGLRVGTTLSPHVHRFNERVRVAGRTLDDRTLCDAFAAVEAARGSVPLTYFEFSALVALCCFRGAAVDVAILEVGLGGRLDAFNLVAADVAVVTSIGLDHQSWLGDDLEGIGREKAGVFRPGQRVVLGAEVTDSVVAAASALGCRTTRLGRDFRVVTQGDTWAFRGREYRFENLPGGGLAAENCALALEAAGHLMPLDGGGAAAALAGAGLPGRVETWYLGPERRLLLLDVAHNPAAARFLRRLLSVRHPGKRFVAVLGMLEDKDAEAVAAELASLADDWICVSTRGARGQSGRDLAVRVCGALGSRSRVCSAGDAGDGLERALSRCHRGDAMLAFGSFDVVEQVRDLLTAGAFDAVPRESMGPRI
ncbi:MAG: bifunctional folylpolyglutamate synthase/dihydrofolate synthase [Pseudomonadota bacterium]